MRRLSLNILMNCSTMAAPVSGIKFAPQNNARDPHPEGQLGTSQRIAVAMTGCLVRSLAPKIRAERVDPSVAATIQLHRRC